MKDAKQLLRASLTAKYQALWGGELATLRPPLFAQAARAAEALRRLPAYRHAQNIAVTAEPALLQVRINALLDGKNLLAATPGLKQGLVRLTPAAVPMARRHVDLQGGAMFKAGKPLPLPYTTLGKVDMLISTALAVDQGGVTLGDGRGLLDVLLAILTQQQSLGARAPLALLLHPEQVVATVPQEEWDSRAQLIITPEGISEHPLVPRAPLLAQRLSAAQRKLPLIKAVLSQLGGLA